MAGMRLFALLLATVLALSGCSVTRFGYEVLPTWVNWQADRYLDLDDDQRDLLARRVDELHQWHQRTQLPVYAVFLREVDAQLEAGVDAADVARWRERGELAWEPLAERMAPGIAQLALTLKSRQIERLRERLEESTVEAREKLLPDGAAARERARMERVVKRAEFFLGRLGRAQIRELRPAVDALPAVEEAWIAEREARNQRIVALLNRIRRDRPSQAEATRLCREFLLSILRSGDPARRLRIEQGIIASDALSVRTLAQATPKQREHLTKLLRGTATDLETLAQR